MKSTSPSFIKSLAGKIHPPLPLQPRDSRKLLGLLKSSFRQQLNEDQKPSPTNAHVASVLASPFFKGSSKSEDQNPKDKPALTSFVNKIQGTLISPMDFFQQQIANGEATLEIARQCLAIQRHNKTIHQSAIDPIISQGQSSVAHPVVHWLWASGLEESMEFVHNERFVAELIYFMVIEKRDRQILKWLHRLERTATRLPKPSNVAETKKLALLLRCYIMSMGLTGGSMNEAINIYLTTLAKFDRSSAKFTFVGPARSLTNSIILNRSATLDSGLYEELRTSIKRSSFSRPDIMAQLELCHPIKPDPSLALQFISDTAEKMSLGSGLTRLVFRRMCRRTAELLELNQDHDTAKELRSFADRIPNDFVSASKITDPKKHQAESTDGAEPSNWLLPLAT